MGKLKRLQDIISPLNSLLFWLAVYPAMYILFRPTLKEFLIMIAVDIAALVALSRLEGKLFLSLFPDATDYLYGISDDSVRAMSSLKRKAFVESCARFPLRRAAFMYFLSFFKVIPSVIVVVFYWHHSISNVAQFGLVMLVAMVNFCYFYAAVFLDAHIFLSQRLQELHASVDLTQAFRDCSIRYTKNEFEIQEFLTLAFTILFMISLQIVLIGLDEYSSRLDLAIKMAAVGGMGLVVFARIWWLGRQFFVGGLESIFSLMGQRDQATKDQTLALHTSPILAKFEKSYNSLVHQIRSSEQELSSLVFQKADENRYRALGEMSAVVAHDLSSPLHAAQFWAQELIDNPSHERQRELLERITTNVKRATELTVALRSKVRNPDGELKSSSFQTVHQNVVKLLEVQILKTDFKRIQFVLDAQLEGRHLEIPETDLTHVLDNIYRNSVTNFLQNSVSQPVIRVSLLKDDGVSVHIAIHDNGTGLKIEDFEDLTSLYFTRRHDGPGRKGLGLRLTRRLVEHRSGDLSLLPTEDGNGTCFILRLKKVNKSGATELKRPSKFIDEAEDVSRDAQV